MEDIKSKLELLTKDENGVVCAKMKDNATVEVPEQGLGDGANQGATVEVPGQRLVDVGENPDNVNGQGEMLGENGQGDNVNGQGDNVNGQGAMPGGSRRKYKKKGGRRSSMKKTKKGGKKRSFSKKTRGGNKPMMGGALEYSTFGKESHIETGVDKSTSVAGSLNSGLHPSVQRINGGGGRLGGNFGRLFGYRGGSGCSIAANPQMGGTHLQYSNYKGGKRKGKGTKGKGTKGKGTKGKRGSSKK